MKKLFEKVKFINNDEKDAISFFNQWFNEISLNLSKEINYEQNNLLSKVLYQFDCSNQLFLYRFLDLINEISSSCNQQNYSSAILTLRASMEITAFAYDLNNKIDSCVKRKEYKLVEEIIFKRIFGSRHNPNFVESLNVMTAIKNVTKKYNDYLETYEELSDYCHPSFKNLSNFYADYSKIENRVFLDKKFINERFNLGLIIKPLFNVFAVYRDLFELISQIRLNLNEIDWVNEILKSKTT